MKKIITISIFFLSILLLTGCGQNITSNNQHQAQIPAVQEEKRLENTKIYENKDLGIKFIYNFDGEIFNGKISVQDNIIFYIDPANSPSQYIALFTKKDNQTVADVILAAVKAKGKNPEDCRVINTGAYWAIPEYQEYVLYLTNPKIAYTEEELQEIKTAETQSAKDGGPFNGEMAKKEIYNQHLIAACSEYADPLGLATSKTSYSRFIYNGKSKILFLPGLRDPAFYQNESIELSD
jgi:hypothetical protein